MKSLFYILGMELEKNPFLFCILTLCFEMIKFQPVISANIPHDLIDIF